MVKKTITPVISVILLIMLVIAVSGTAWYWVNSLQANLESSAGEQVDQTSSFGNTLYMFAVDPICNKSANITLTLMNVGGTTISATEIPIISLQSSSGETLATTTVPRLSGNLETTGDNQIRTITFETADVDGASTDWSALMTTGSRYQIVVNLKSVIRSAFCTATE